MLSALEEHLCRTLRDLPKTHANRFTTTASNVLLEALFRSLRGDDVYTPLFFPHGAPSKVTDSWSLRDAQGAIEGAEYTPAARGKPCGHIFKSGEATYRCKTCSIDDTCVLCSKCFDSSDHTDHMVYVSISPGNSGCCDCGDAEAWRLPVNCAIHTVAPDNLSSASGGLGQGTQLPDDLVETIRMTVGRALDYLCDVISCSPEQLRLPKTRENIELDERLSRLTSKWYGGDVIEDGDPEFALILWNDEKHTVTEVENQVSRACKETRQFGKDKANETNDIGRSVITHSKDISKLLGVAKIIEEIKVTVTIRSSRDTFREQMCGTIIEWLMDIAGCSVGGDHDILRRTICEEMLKLWRTGSEASNAEIGKKGIDDHERDETTQLRRFAMAHTLQADLIDIDDDDDDDDDDENDDQNDNDDGEEDEEDDGEDDDEMDLDEMLAGDPDGDLDMDAADDPEDETEVSEATYAGYPPPPPPPPPPPRQRDHDHTPSDSESGEPSFPRHSSVMVEMNIPKTPNNKSKAARPPRPPKYWLEKPAGYNSKEPLPVYEDLWQRVRLDWMVLFDLRMWKKARIDLRDLYISTVVTIPQFKRILGLRFAGLYTTLAQLYLIADREPDHSIINLSLQMLTTPSITDEVVERGNFLTNLLAILYTFLTTRQVGHPQDSNPLATLAFDAGSVTNRRMYHFFMDLKYLFGSEHVQEKLRTEERYTLQFLDLVKLHQGICPNIRAVGEHVEYETDAWISASLITREINRLCRQFAESFRWRRDEDDGGISKAIRLAAKITILNSMGAERRRFDQAEIKGETRFKPVNVLDYVMDGEEHSEQFQIVDFVVEREPISFHHALHYTLSWLIECGKSMPRDQLHGLMLFTARELREPPPSKLSVPDRDPESYLLALFDFPLRVCAWLAQMKAGMWVRNGLSLRHQMSTYRGVSQRDVAHHRDIFLMQAALVICDPTRVLASMIDRFHMNEWMKGVYRVPPGYEDVQIVDVAEDFIHLMIVLLSDRLSLLPIEDEPNPQVLAIRRDIAHILCFKPLSFSELCNRLADKFQDLEEFQDILEEMTNFRAPEGLSDSGTFELKEEYLEDIDPYIAHYSKNQREEAENAYRTRVAKRTGKPASEVVFEPKLRPIPSGVFKGLGKFTSTHLFAQIIYYSLFYALRWRDHTSNIPDTRVEAFLQVALHLTLLAVVEDHSSEDDISEESQQSFVNYALTQESLIRTQQNTIVSVLHQISTMDEYKACNLKVRLILRRMKQRRPKTFESIVANFPTPTERLDTESPASAGGEDLELKRKLARDRQAKVMASFQQQQKTFLEAQGDIDWGEDDFSDIEPEPHTPPEEQRKLWKYPSGNCILCQEETNDSRLYGTFALMMDSNILRQTDVKDSDFVAEAATTPVNLDHSADDIRPFGVAGQNRETVRKLTSNGTEIVVERQGLGKGFPSSQVRRGPVTTGCGHIMHYECFELYYQATQRRQAHQIARNHPERLAQKEFVCPLCKALGNAFLPIIWKGKEEVFPGVLQTEESFDEWLCCNIGPTVSRLEKGAESEGQGAHANARHQEILAGYLGDAIITPLAMKLDQLINSSYGSPVHTPQPSRHQHQHHHQHQHAHQMPGIFPLDEPLMANPQVQAAGNGPSPTAVLMNIYKRLRDTMKVNQLSSRYSYPPTTSGVLEDLTYTDTLAKSLGYSISSVEICQRGVQSELGSTLLDKISEQTLTHLRILSETVSSYIATGALRNGGGSKTFIEYADTHSRQLHQLFIGHPQIFDHNAYTLNLKQMEPLLSQDIFTFLTECSVCIVPALHLDIHHLLRLCYLAEIVKVTLAFLSESDVLWRPDLYSTNVGGPYSQEQLDILRAFVDTVFAFSDNAVQPFISEPAIDPVRLSEILYRLVSSYALTFLRKAVILLNVRYGVDFPNTGFTDIEESELSRLTKVLRLPTLDQMFVSLVNDHNATATRRFMVAGWIRHWVWTREGHPSSQQTKTALSLSHPGIFELVGLPKNFDTLTDEAMRRRCPKTGKDLSDPSICLFCGDIFCSQAVCCSRDGRYGGCNNHLEKCGRDVGIFINIRKCTVLYLHAHNGSWSTAPYLDKHGEVDPGLRRSRQLFLNQRRYDALLRNVWLHHGIPTTISRKLEADTNNGGWETI
ncbi:MAG: hypothetical protein M1819_002437 [Sarea resinae]|nr:MAG: hypothetical protein M1819_002437 [Sarea resinae]